MFSWFLRTIGIDNAFIENLDDVSIAVQHPDVLIVGFTLLVPLGIFIYIRQKRNLPSTRPFLRATLAATRVIVLALMIIVLAGPYAKLELKNEKKPIVAVLIDQSQSMYLDAGPFAEADARRLAIAAGYRTSDGPLDSEMRREFDRKARLKLLQEVLIAQQPALFEPIRNKFELRFVGFGRNQEVLSIDPAAIKFPDLPPSGGSGTYIGSAIAQVMEEAAGRPVAGIIILSDGENTGGRSPVELAQVCGAAGTPIFVVPVGTANRLKDVAIIDVSTSGQVAAGDTAKVSVTVESQGYDQRTIKVLLRDSGDSKILDTKELILRGTEQQQVELTFKPDTAGARYLTVEIAPQADEDLKNNNADIGFLRVTDAKLKVLYIEGLPRWDYRFLKNAMMRDTGLAGRLGKSPEIVLEAEWRRLPESQQLNVKELPRTLDELSAYHTVILGDVSPKLLSPAFLELLDKAVREKGVGLLIQGGPQHLPHDFDENLLELLPVQINTKARGLFANPAKPFRFELTPDGMLHETMRLHDDVGRNQNTWNQMLPYQWCIAATRPMPAASVVAWNPNIQNNYGKLPLISYHQAGEGRVMLVGTDSTWLWRKNVADRFFYKFWGQSIRFVARRDDAGKKKSWIEVQPVRAQPGEEARIELMAYTGDGTPISQPSLAIQVTGPGVKTTLTLTADPNTKGRYAGAYPVPREGEFKFTFLGSGSTEPAEARIRALPAPEEYRYPNVNRMAMQLIATTSGGKLVELTELPTIVGQLKGEVKKSQLRREATIWDNWLLLTILVVVYSIDVGLRRLSGLS